MLITEEPFDEEEEQRGIIGYETLLKKELAELRLAARWPSKTIVLQPLDK